MDPLTRQALSSLLLALRIAPAFAFAPPFTLFRIPATVRVLLGLSLAAWLVTGAPVQTWQSSSWIDALVETAASELLLGISLGLSLQLAFAAMMTAGRAIDIQAGFGLAVLVDPTTRSQMPLVGTLFGYAAGAIFFASSGPADLLAIWSASVVHIPLGAGTAGGNIGPLLSFLGSSFVMACGLGGSIVLALFMADLSIAFMSRTLPQMNVMLLGFQVKALVTLALLPATISLSAALFFRLLESALLAAPQIAGA